MAAEGAKPIRHPIAVSQFTGHPIYYFDTSVLLDNVVSLAGWNPARLEAAIAPRIENILGPSDTRIAANDGFYVILVNQRSDIARAKAYAIRDDLLTHFYGRGGPPPDVADRLCRPSSTQALAGILGMSLDRAAPPRAKKGPPVIDEPADQKNAAFTQELQTLFVDSDEARTAKFGRFLFSPLWDCKNGRISAFVCSADPRREIPKMRRMSPEDYCRHDIALLASATTAIRYILSQNDLAAVSTPVHVETLTWSKTWNGYLEILGHIDPKVRALLVLRIIGLEPGANLSKIGQWTAGLHRHVRIVFVRLPNLNFDFSRVGALGVAGYGIPANSSEHPNANALKILSADAARLSRLCASQNASALMDNVASQQEFALVKSQGVRFIAGPAIGAPSEMPALKMARDKVIG